MIKPVRENSSVVGLPVAVRHTWRRRPVRSPFGLTLLELILVLVILVSLFALLIPRLTATASRRELRDAAGQLQASMMQARNRALRTGRPIVVVYQPQSPFYASVDPVVSGLADVGMENAAAAPVSGSLQAVQSRMSQLASEGEDAWAVRLSTSTEAAVPIRRLPRDVVFADPGRTERFVPNGGLTEDAMAMPLPGLSLPGIVFYADGTADDGWVVLESLRGEDQLAAVIVRGLNAQLRVEELSPTDGLSGAGLP